MLWYLLYDINGVFMMWRRQIETLQAWLNGQNRKPLVIRGARQVGKSTLVELFAEQCRMPLRCINLERHPELDSVFATNDPRQIMQQLEFLPGIGEINPGTILFFDEIQALPAAIPVLRYFYEEFPEIPLISAGSLLEFALTRHDFSMPVGRIQYLHMSSMTFSEFLAALDESRLKNFIEAYEPGQTIGEVVHQRLLSLLRSYYFIGGMPEAVAVFAESRSYKKVSEVHNSIIETYRDDFPKYAGSRNLNRMLKVFNFAARNVGVKVKYSNITRQEQSSTLKKDIELLTMARVFGKVTHSHCSGLPLQADNEETVYKLLFLDVGLMNAVCGLDWQSISAMEEANLVNQGAVAEQFVGQHLKVLLADKPNRDLNYWLREGRSNNAEVDFVVACGSRIVPIEVKAGATGALKSLHQFMGTKPADIAVRFNTQAPRVDQVDTFINAKQKQKQIKYNLLSLPLYLVERLLDLVVGS